MRGHVTAMMSSALTPEAKVHLEPRIAATSNTSAVIPIFWQVRHTGRPRIGNSQRIPPCTQLVSGKGPLWAGGCSGIGAAAPMGVSDATHFRTRKGRLQPTPFSKPLSGTVTSYALLYLLHSHRLCPAPLPAQNRLCPAPLPAQPHAMPCSTSCTCRVPSACIYGQSPKWLPLLHQLPKSRPVFALALTRPRLRMSWSITRVLHSRAHAFHPCACPSCFEPCAASLQTTS